MTFHHFSRTLGLGLILASYTQGQVAPRQQVGPTAREALTPADFTTSAHPRLYARTESRQALLEKIRTVEWARTIYEQLKQEVDPLVNRHADNPAWIVSRLQMNWKDGEHFTNFNVNGNTIPKRGGNAPFPTVCVAYNRVSAGKSPKSAGDFSILSPYGDGSVPLRDGQGWKWVPLSQSGLASEDINQAILEHAHRAAIVYYFTGDKRYAKFAADIIWTFIRGASYHNPVNPDDQGGIHGFLSFETLGDTRRFTTVAITYDFIHDYLHNEYFALAEFEHGRSGELWAPPQPGGKAWAEDRVRIYFQKFIENKLNRGGGLGGNWNLNEHVSALLYALAMDDDDIYSDKRGREYFVGQLLNGPTSATHGAYLDVVAGNIDPETGLWPEPPGSYGQGSIGQLVQFGFWYFQNGIDVLSKDPLLLKAATSFSQMSFPNGMSTGWGDSNYSPMGKSTAEYLVAYARAKKNPGLEAQFTAQLHFAGGRSTQSGYYDGLFFFVPALAEQAVTVNYPRTSFSPEHSLVFGRNASDDPLNALAFTIYGFGKDSGHRHRNGLAMELYGRGQVLGIDPGAGPNYWDPQHVEYNSQVAAHNTVIPNGLAADDKLPMDIVVENAEPEVRAGAAPKFQASPNNQFVDVSAVFRAVEGTADQRRVIGIIRTSPTSGYYIDIFRSRSQGNGNQRHDYLYHNIGRSATLAAEGGGAISNKGAALDSKSGPGFRFFQDSQSTGGDQTLCSTVDTGMKGIKMAAWVLGREGRTVFSMNGPSDFRYNIQELQKDRVPTLLVRQIGEAWERPFVVAYEPYGNPTKPTINGLRSAKNAPAAGDFVALAVDRVDGTDIVLNATNQNEMHSAENVEFRGTYAVVTKTSAGNVLQLYLGHGTHLSAGGYTIDTVEPTAVWLRQDGKAWKYTAPQPIYVTTSDGRKTHCPAAVDAELPRGM